MDDDIIEFIKNSISLGKELLGKSNLTELEEEFLNKLDKIIENML